MLEYIWRLSGVAKKLILGRRGVELDASDTDVVSFRLPDHSGLTRLKGADPIEDTDLVNLISMKAQVIRHSQVSAQDTWNIPHGFPYQPAVDVIIGGEQAYPTVDYPSAIIVRIRFSRPETGEATLR